MAKTKTPEGAEIALNIHTERRRKRWRLVDLASRSGIPVSSLSRYEIDASDMPVERLHALARALKVPVERLLATGRKASGDRVPVAA
jgi:transcriptional regulator with XRE-family HTH domain